MLFLLLHTTKVITCLVQCFINLHTVEKEGKWDPFNIDCGYKVLNNEINSTLSVLIFACTYFREFREFWSISQN